MVFSFFFEVSSISLSVFQIPEVTLGVLALLLTYSFMGKLLTFPFRIFSRLFSGIKYVFILFFEVFRFSGKGRWRCVGPGDNNTFCSLIVVHLGISSINQSHVSSPRRSINNRSF